MGIDLPCPAFPNLTATNYSVTSDPTDRYNCIGWAAGDDRNWWWPVGITKRGYWPDGVPREETVEAFVAAFATVGFEPCPDRSVDQGYEKVAIYTLDGIPTHAARQLPDGRWTSKLGKSFDIDHDLDTLDGPVYGSPALFLRRTR
ncbi:MAG: hypothetical protein K2X82_25310 [Gemmataceae bacterium]|nr:hypothetical protein [Gemmataceae bacterium]